MNNMPYTMGEQVTVLQRGSSTSPRVLVCYRLSTTNREEDEFIARVLADLRAAGAQAVIDQFTSADGVISDEVDLQGCQWVIVVQTDAAITSPRIKAVVQAALAQSSQQSLPGVLRVITPAASEQEVPAAWRSLPAYDASKDYPRALAAMLLAINARSSTGAFAIRAATAPVPVSRARLAPTPPVFRKGRRRPQSPIPAFRWSSPIWLSLIAMMVILSFVVTIFVAGLNKPVAAGPHKSAAAAKIAARVSTVAAMPAPGRVNTLPVQPATPTDPLFQQITSRTPLINDTLQVQDNNWQVSNQNNQSCQFVNNTYDITLTPPDGNELRGFCLAQNAVFSNLAYQIDMRFLNTGQENAMSHKGGIVFRSDGGKNYYWFSVTSQGCYEFFRSTSQGMQDHVQIVKQTCPSLNVQNTMQLTVIAQGPQISLYLDGHLLTRHSATKLTNGLIGVMAISKDQKPTEVQFSNAKVWQL